MPKISFDKPSAELKNSGKVVGITDRIYEINGQSVIKFDDVLVKGDLSGELEYNNKKILITHIDSIIGLEVNLHGARGPVWKGVECKVVA